MARGLSLALQFLTRLPAPAVRDFRADDLSRSAAWFPIVGLVVGGFVALPLAAGALIDPWLGALAGLLAWLWITGGLHLDGLADLADALGAAHRDRTRFLEVLRDPHLGAFGVMALVAAILAKLVLLAVAVRQSSSLWYALPLIAAWARLGPIVWSAWLPALASGTAEKFAWKTSRLMIAAWSIALALASALLAPALLIAPVVILGWGAYLARRLGGVTGDCLGAGVEVTEIALLVCAVAGSALPTLSARV
jgi:adenosylcobinamide-GDP ribazoletransferase